MELYSTISDNKNNALFVGMPENPYLSMSLVGARAEADTFNKSRADQIKLLKTWQQSYPEYFAMNLPGFLVLQAFETRAKLTAARASGQANFQVRPLDYWDDSANTSFTRFLDLPVSYGSVPDGYFYPDSRQLTLSRGDDGADPRYGFRLERRVPLST